MKGQFLSFFLLSALLPAGVAGAEVLAVSPERKLSVGERIVYAISYLGIPVGKAEAEVEGIVPIQGRRAYHVTVRVRSYPMIDLVYKVRDEHHSFIDTEHLYSLRYEKNLQEGRRQVRQIMVYDQGSHEARNLLNPARGPEPIAAGSQDEVSCGYFFRTLDLEGAGSLWIPVHAEGKNWKMEVKLHRRQKMDVPGVGKIPAVEIEPVMGFQGIFFRRGKVRGWIGLDKRRIPIKMKVNIPVLGSVSSKLTDYRPGRVQE